MKAIVMVNQGSAYKKFNYRTFEVLSLLSSFIVLDIDGVSVDFRHNECLIVDVDYEYKMYRSLAIMGDKKADLTFQALKRYVAQNNIQRG